MKTTSKRSVYQLSNFISTAYLLGNRRHALSEAGETELLPNRFRGTTPDAPTLRRVVPQAKQGLAQRGGVTRRDENRRLAVAGIVADAGRVGNDHRLAPRHRPQKHRL